MAVQYGVPTALHQSAMGSPVAPPEPALADVDALDEAASAEVEPPVTVVVSPSSLHAAA
jgi:hypothetical protein